MFSPATGFQQRKQGGGFRNDSRKRSKIGFRKGTRKDSRKGSRKGSMKGFRRGYRKGSRKEAAGNVLLPNQQNSAETRLLLYFFLPEVDFNL